MFRLYMLMLSVAAALVGEASANSDMSCGYNWWLLVLLQTVVCVSLCVCAHVILLVCTADGGGDDSAKADAAFVIMVDATG